LTLAASKVGAAAVPLNYRLADREAAYVVDHCDATVVYADAEFVPMFARIKDAIPQVRDVLVYAGDPGQGMTGCDALIERASSGPPQFDGEGGATIIYTSGTTGKPKGAFRRSVSGSASYMELLQLLGYRNDDVHITTGPLYHSGPGAFLSIALAFGQTAIVQRQFDAEDWLRLVSTYQCTNTFSAPTPIRMVCNLAGDIKAKYDRSSMRIMVANAAPWPLALKLQYVADFPPESLWEVYGSTELGINTVLRPEDQLRKPGSCGTPAPGVEIRLYDSSGELVIGTGPEAAGELFVRSPAVFEDYFKQHDKFEEDRRDGFQTVGDIAYRDDEGYYYICDRKKDMIISGGMNIYPAEVEAALELHPDVFEAAVFGIPSDEWGESVHAVVVLRPNSQTNEDDVIAHARQELAGYKVPRSVSFLDELPKTGSGKLLKRELRRPYWEGRAANI
jgi:fatty-acyl-CoA synthase/long-chain acyl-CoA synthetase